VLCGDHEGGGGSQEDEDKHEPEPVLSFTEAHSAFQMV
jgi:hypothetical protein